MPHRILLVGNRCAALIEEQSALAQAGYLVTCETTFGEAKRRLMLAPPDLLVADVRLGAYNGLHLVHRIRQAGLDTPVILRDDAPDVVIEQEAGQADAMCLPRRMPVAQFLGAVRVSLTGRPADPATEAARRWQRRPAQVDAMLENAAVRVLDLSYGGLRVEIPQPVATGAFGEHAEFHLPAVGTFPVRVVWTRTAGESGPSWCGMEVEERASDRWRGFLDARTRNESAAGQVRASTTFRHASDVPL